MANYQLEQTGAEVQALLNAVESPDTTPAAGSSNLITSGAVQAAVAGVSAEVTALGQEVSDLDVELYGLDNVIVPTSAYENGAYNGSGVYSSTTDNYFVVPIAQFRGYHISLSPNNKITQYGFASAYVPQTSLTWCAGTSRMNGSFPDNTIVPSDCNYLYIFYSANTPLQTTISSSDAPAGDVNDLKADVLRIDGALLGIEGDLALIIKKYLKLGASWPSYYNFGSSYALANTGDYFEVDVEYTGTGNDFYDKLYILTNNNGTRSRFGYYSDTEVVMRVRGSGNTDLTWDISGVNIKARHLLKVAKTATGFELFIDGVSQGVKTYSGDGTYDFSYLSFNNNSAGFVGKYYSVKYYNGTLQELDIFDSTKMTGCEAVKYFYYPEVSDTLAALVGRVDKLDAARCYYSYDSATETFMAYVNIPGTSYYLGFSVMHISSAGTLNNPILYKDLWEIDDAGCYLYQLNGGAMASTGLKILSDGESEFVGVQIGACDNFGGIHGDERIDISSASFVKFYADGVLLDTTGDIDLTPANEVSYIQKSTMHKTAIEHLNYQTIVPTSSGTGVLSLTGSYTYAIDGVDTGLVAYGQNKVYTTIAEAVSTDSLTLGTEDGYWTISKVRLIDESHTIVATHNKETIFGERGYTTKNSVIFTADGAALTYNFYHGISCVNKNAAEYGHNENYTDQHFTGGGSNYLRDDDFRMFEAYNATNGLSVFVTSEVKDTGATFTDEQCKMFVWDRAGDSKYYRQTPNFQPAENYRFASVMSVKWNKISE